MTKKIGVIGSGFSSLSSACYLAKQGQQVSVFEKNDSAGGRARQFRQQGFTFDMGPSWYWMPDVFDTFFEQFNVKRDDFYSLQLLDPGFRIFFGTDTIDIPANKQDLMKVFEEIESGAGKKLESFLLDGAYKYQVGMQDLVYKPGLKISELIDMRILKSLFKLNIATPFDKFVAKYFKHPYLQRIMEFPILFLGAAPNKTPALYSLMNYAGLELGTWYPDGGMFKVIEGMVKLATQLGVEFHFDSEISKIEVSGHTAKRLITKEKAFEIDGVIAGADYHHVEQSLLEPQFRNYTAKYWENRTMAPSSILYYLGIDKKLDNLLHHNLFFDEDLNNHAQEIYEQPKWPSKPLFYVCCPSQSDRTVAPNGKENLFILIPVAPGLKNDINERERFFEIVMKRLEQLTGQSIKEHISYRRDYSQSNFIEDYHSYKGNAYGLANTLLQTANLKPKIRNKQIQNLFYTGHLTVPGPGVPPSLISGKVVATELNRTIGK